MTLQDLLPLPRPSDTSETKLADHWSRETAACSAAIVAALVFDHLVGGRVGITLGFATLVAVLLRRPRFAVPGLAVAFLAGTALALWNGAGAVAPVRAAADVAVAVAILMAARPLIGAGLRVRSARMLIEVLFVVALAAPLAGAGVAALLVETPLARILDLARLTDWPSGVLGAVVVVPVALLAGREDVAGGRRWVELGRLAVASVAIGAIAWFATIAFPFPFVVVCVPLLAAAAHFPPTAVALLGAACAVEMTLVGRFLQTPRGDVHEGAIVLAAALTGILPIALALLLAELKSERQRLAETGGHLRQVLAGVAGHGFFSLDRAGRVTAWNDKIAEVTGFSAEEVLGKSFAFLLPEDQRAKGVPEMLLAQAAEKGHVECVGWRLRGDGRRYWARTVIEAVTDEAGRVVGFTKSHQDQSDLQRSESALLAAERRIGFALGSAGQGIWELDLAEKRMHYSDIYAAMLGLSASDLGEDPAAWKARVHPDDIGKIPPDAAGDEAGETELRLRHADGRWIWVADRRRIAERDEADWPVRVIGTHTDITARKLAEERFRLAVDASPNGMLIADANGRITLVNREVERMFGYDDGTLLGRSIEDLVPEAMIAEHAARRIAFVASPSVRLGAGRDLSARRRDGTLFPVEIGLNPITTTEGTQVLCVVTDITARKLAEEKFRLAVEASPHGVLIADRDGRITLINSEIERMFGYEPGTLLGRSIDILVPEEHRGNHAMRRGGFSARPAARRMGASRELNGRRADGTLFPVEIGLNPIVTAEGESILCVVTDITTRKQTEAELAMSEARYRMMADHFVDLVVHLDLDLNRTWVSPASRDILGVEPESLIGKTPSGIVHPEDLPVVQEALRTVAAGGDRSGYCVRYRHSAGHWIWMEVSLRLIRMADGSPVGVLAVGRDVTRARAAEEALKASEARFRGAMESASIGMALEELDGRWVSVNRALCRILGMEEEDLLRLGPAAFTHPVDAEADIDQRRRLLAGEIPSFQTEKRWRNRAGGVVWTHQSVSLDKAPEGAARRLILQIQDITERRQIELMKSEFVSMVSHELRTPLTSIRGALGLVLGTMTGDMPTRAVHLVDIAHKNSERLIPLVNDILDLDKIDAGMVRVDLAEVDAADLVRQAVEATRSFCDRYGVTVAITAPATRVGIRADEGRFLQVVTNLLSNAAKFSPRDSVVEIATTVTDGRVRIAVRDHGSGIPDEFRAKIFGRFAQADSATTRAKGGSGLGLHICRQLVVLMGGTIDYESTVGEGSTFWVEFPFVDTAAAPARAEAPEAHPAIEAAAPRRPRVTFLAGAGPATDFLLTSMDEAGVDASTVLAPDTVAVLVDVAVAGTPTGDDLRADLRARGEDRPPVYLVTVGTGDAEAAVAAREAWSARETWTVEPDAPRRIVARIANVAGVAPPGLPRILHVEDDRDLAAVVAEGLSGLANVTCVARASQALRQLEATRFDLVVIDPALPDGDGITRLVPRLVKKSIPYMILSAEERPDAAGSAVASLVKSRIDERQLVETILSILSDRRRKPEETRHVG